MKGVILDRVGAEFGPGLGRVWAEGGPSLGRVWAEGGPSLGQIRPSRAAGLLGACLKPGQHLVRPRHELGMSSA